MYEQHGATAEGRRPRLYRIWRAMKNRCEDSTQDNFPAYGGRGISVCPEWSTSFVVFRDWALPNGYSDELSIDRLDPNDNYQPGNCRWATSKEQAVNKREAVNVPYIEWNGLRLNLMEWSRHSGISYTTLRKRYLKGLRGEPMFAAIDSRKSHPVG